MFFFNDTATTEIYTLSLHDALPIFARDEREEALRVRLAVHERAMLAQSLLEPGQSPDDAVVGEQARSEEHTSELQSRQYLVCRLLLEKKKKPPTTFI